jgi:hypothetical protein
MIKFQLSNVVESSLIFDLLNFYHSSKSYKTSTMNKLDATQIVNQIVPKLESILEKKLEYTGGNFYKHSKPYLPHTDYKSYEDNTLNIVIPLHYNSSAPHLIIFNQTWNLDSITWCMHYPVQYFEYNIGVKGCPFEYPVQNLTNKEIDNEFYIKYLQHYPKQCLYGLSGEAFKFEPCSIIVFDNRYIHCTSSMIDEKIGLTLRFKK